MEQMLHLIEEYRNDKEVVTATDRGQYECHCHCGVEYGGDVIFAGVADA